MPCRKVAGVAGIFVSGEICLKPQYGGCPPGAQKMCEIGDNNEKKNAEIA